MKRKIDIYSFAIVFLILVFGLGILSYRRLVNFYVNNEIDYNEWTPQLGNKLETDIASTFYNKVGFVNLNGLVCRLFNQPQMNGVVKLNNGYLMSPMSYSSDETLDEYVQEIIPFNNYLHNRGTKLVYVSTPYTCSKFDPQIPKGIEDYGNNNIDRFLDRAKAANIDCIDIRECMNKDDINQYDMMYKTDHHWTTEGGFYAFGIIEDYIKSKTGCETEPRISDINNYEIKKYKEWHLGSNGQRTGRYYAGIDDFDLITPRFDTLIMNDEGNVGKMQDLLLDMSPLNVKDYTSRYTYDSVLKNSMGHYVNKMASNNIKIIIITDSYGRAVCPYLTIDFEEIYYFSRGIVSEITTEFIEEYDPDVVIMLYYPAVLQEDSQYAFNFLGY